MKTPEPETVDYIAGDRSRRNAGKKRGRTGSKQEPGATLAPGAAAAEAARPSAMIEEGERPRPDHGSVEGLESSGRSGGMIGEG